MNKPLFRKLLPAFAALLLTTVSAQAYSPYESVSVTSHYDANGTLVGVEAYGPCGFSLYGTTGAYSTNRVITCGEIDEVELPF